jgi:hypothetical protein
LYRVGLPEHEPFRIPALPQTKPVPLNTTPARKKAMGRAFAAIVPPDADAGKVAEAIVAIVDAPFGKRPFRVHFDPTQDGADVTFTVVDRVRAEMLHRVGLPELLSPVKGK